MPNCRAALGVTEATLRRQFKAQLGIPIHTFVLQKKMALAGDLLRNSTLPSKRLPNNWDTRISIFSTGSIGCIYFDNEQRQTHTKRMDVTACLLPMGPIIATMVGEERGYIDEPPIKCGRPESAVQ